MKKLENDGKKEFFIDDRFLQDITGYQPLTQEEEKQLCKRMKRGDEKARELFINSNLLFVVSVANRFRSYNVPMDDLVAAGCEGMVVAADKFDPARDSKFITYAVWWVNSFIDAAIREMRYGISFNGIVSLDQPVYTDREGNEITRASFLKASSETCPDSSLLRKESVERIAFYLRSILPTRDANIMIDYYRMEDTGDHISLLASRYGMDTKQIRNLIDYYRRRIMQMASLHQENSLSAQIVDYKVKKTLKVA